MRILAIALALLAGTAAAAQTTPPPQQQADPDDIIVVGTADRDRQVHDFVGALTAGAPDGPLARFDLTAVCPAAVGLSQASNSAIADRMRAVAREVGIRVAAPGCRPNVLVIFARDNDQMIKAMRKRHPIYFQDAANRPVAIPRQRGPATAWHLEGRIDRSGMPVSTTLEGVDVVSTPVAPSRLSTAVRPIFMASVVVIELDSVVALTTTQVGDYAAMRAFARVDPARIARTNAPTILTVLEAPMNSLVPQTLTHWDLSYLRALYASAEYQRVARQRREIGQRMTKDLQKAQQGAE